MLSSIATSYLRTKAASRFAGVAAVASRSTTPSSAFSFTSRSFSSDSHDDFAPKRKVVEGEDEALKIIKQHIESNPIMLYMKGNPSMPMCKFLA